MSAKGLLAALMTVFTVGACGCGQSRKPVVEPHLNIVSGYVKFSGDTVNMDECDGAVVRFHPKTGTAAEQKLSGTLNEGRFQINTEESGKKTYGVAEGEYLITIAPSEGRAQPIPAKYADPSTSGLVAVVSSGSTAQVNLELTP